MVHALWKGAISFGLVTIPVSLYPAKDSKEQLAFHMLHADDLARVHNKRVDEQDHEVPWDNVVRGYEYEKDRYVVIEESDLRAANVEATQSIDILHFVDAAEIDIAYFDTPYYTEPAKAGRKAYALLRETMKHTNRAGVAKIVIRERQHLCALMADGPVLLAFTLRWPYQLRGPAELDLPTQDLAKLGVSTQEIKMAEQLVEAMAAEWEPEEYRDTYHEDLLKLIEEKIRTGKVTEVPAEPVATGPSAAVVDIMTLLKQSVERRKADAADRNAQHPVAKSRKRA